MVTIRLARIGKRGYPTYRVVVSDKRKDTKGPFLEQLGVYDPHAASDGTRLKADRVQYWLGVGATASPSVHNLLVAAKLLDAKTVPLGRAKRAASAEGEGKPAESPKAETKPAEPRAEATSTA